MSNGVLYKAADGSWRQTKRRAGTLQPRERWALLNDDRVLVVHPNRPPKVVYPDGRVEQNAAIR